MICPCASRFTDSCPGPLTFVAANFAVIVVDVALLSVDGGVYAPPLVSVPTVGFMVHVTPVFDAPLTKAVNCCATAPAWTYIWSFGNVRLTPVSTTRCRAVWVGLATL